MLLKVVPPKTEHRPLCASLHGCFQSMQARLWQRAAATRPRKWKVQFGHAGTPVPSIGHQACLTASSPRHSHSKPHHVPYAQRELSMLRPAESYSSATGIQRKKGKQLLFLATPTDPLSIKSPQRSPKFSHQRARMKECKTSAALLKCLSDAVDANKVDASVIGAAMQTCGHKRWWETLMQVHDKAHCLDVEFDRVQGTIFMNSAACLQRSQCCPTELAARKNRALSLSKHSCNLMPSPSSELDFQCQIGPAWRVCAEVGEQALPWAEEILSWCKTQKYAMTSMQYGPLLALFERCKHRSRVESLLHEIMHRQGLSRTEVELGGLINAAGSGNGSRRSGTSW
ncbi:unnamed protein product [Symbiodinium natans]|uniref:Uncharacterized protein n=1 Tax=Symbiodinium natans TaxID=878477 RepID=A0A812LL83_9DINO|nr:unnamed protein product [Symbiodinium natans]